MSRPSPPGRLDEEAYRFVDWLVEAGQAWWQLLPLHIPDELGSPYASRSAFAGFEGLLAPPGSPHYDSGEGDDGRTARAPGSRNGCASPARTSGAPRRASSASGWR